MSYYMLSGLGAIAFSSGAVWSDWLRGAPPTSDNAAGRRAANAIRAALAQLGYGTVTLDQNWGASQDKAAYSKFASDNGVSPPGGMPSWWPSQAGVDKLGELVAAGGTPGGLPVQEFHAGPGGELIPGPAPGTSPIGTPVAKAGMTGMQMGLLAVAAIVVVGGLAVMSKKKKPGTASSGYGGSSAMTVHATPNRRHRRRHARR